MAFPATPLDLRAELDLAGTWTAVTSYVYQRDGMSPPVVISRGRPDEASSVNPSSCTFQVNNRDGRFSPANPLGAYYGQIGRNTPVRFSVPAQVNYMRLEADSVSYASAPDSAGLSITGDTEIQLDVWLSSWQACALAAKWGGSGDDTWALLLNGDGTLSLVYYDGSVTYTSTSTLPLPVQHRIAVKATLQLNDGAGNHVVTFYTASSIAGSWSILGTAVTVAGTVASLHDSAAAVTVGYSTGYSVTDANTGYSGMNGRVYEFRLISGIGGTTKADPVFSGRSAGDTTWADAQSNTWTLHGTAEISDRDYRYHGELSSLPPKWDVTATDIYVPVTAGGLLRRIGQNSGSLASPVRRYYTVPSAPAVAAYWPMEDGSGSASLAAVAGGWAMYFTGSPKLASSSAFTGSSSLPVTSSAQFAAKISYTGTWTDNDCRFLVQIPAGGETTGSVVASFATSGTLVRMDLVYNTASGGQLELFGYNSAGSPVLPGAPLINGVNGIPLAVQIVLQQSGGNINVTLACETLTVTSPTTSVAGTVGGVTGVALNPDGTLTGTVPGHVAVLPVYTALTGLYGYVNADGTTTGPLTGWLGEQAAVRYARLAAEEGFQARITGPPKTSAAMGVQSTSSLSSLLQECEDADRGQQYEPRTCLGLGYRTLASMLNQAAAVTLDYSLAELGGTSGGTLLEPVYDDRYTRNDVTVSRSGGNTAGSSYTYALNDGSAMSVSNPPAGAGDYPASVSLSLETDARLRDEAGWLVRLGTVSEARWPVIPVNLARSPVTSLYYPLLAADIGDYASLSNMLTKVTYDPVKQLLWQVRESLGGFFHELEWSCVPESPYEVIVLDDATYGRCDTDGSSLHASYAAGATSLQVDISGSNPLWTTADVPFDIAVAGERMTVTAVSGSSSPQTFTVTRAVNGVSKAQSSGADVRLWFPPVLSLT